LDGCLLVQPNALEILKVYVDTYNTELFKILEEYWNDYGKYGTKEIFNQISFLLLDYQNRMTRFGINDLNLSMCKIYIIISKGIDETLTLFTKKNYFDLLEYLDSILKLVPICSLNS